MPTPYVVILITAKDKKEAAKIAQGLLRAKLIACANIISGVQSLFRWQGKIESSAETLLLLKTTSDRLSALEVRLNELHSYQTPEFVVLAIESGSHPYLAWLEASLREP